MRSSPTFSRTQTAPDGWYGDRWQSAPDGVKGHDFTYWSPLAFAADGNITAFAWVDNFTITVSHP